MGDQGVVDDVETHGHNGNRTSVPALPGVKPAIRGKVRETDRGGVPMPDLPELPDHASRADASSQETDAERRRRRAQFLRELAEARELRDRVQPRRAKTARLRHAMRMRTFRW
ncbi:hypothetical protein SSP24_62080 [Streptomyces spinoverrucosus]|uniref:Uncharacterized protein n=2 Tax=Streptomyces spinoverrucosus TaxID=284043 RepID=A0A4Y3VPN0_9ACTN|nr:hypothetical protein SSP24_62080 [Streptomyces spinoverrucosus]GHB87842.1 hypothetical protein GCM10010397_69640 [Streptomyces spinoverrucosus]